MKTLNNIAILIPIFIGLLGIIEESLIILALVSTMATGFIQIIVGVMYWIKFPKSIHIKIYFFFVIVFFILLFTIIADEWVWLLPPILCIYISTLVYSLKEKNHEK
jgi:hypothetical protein